MTPLCLVIVDIVKHGIPWHVEPASPPSLSCDDTVGNMCQGQVPCYVVPWSSSMIIPHKYQEFILIDGFLIILVLPSVKLT